MSKEPIAIGKYRIGKECGGRWFPGIGRGYWDGWHYFIFRQKPKINLKFRTYRDGFAIGPLMIWDDTRTPKLRYNPRFDPKYLENVGPPPAEYSYDEKLFSSIINPERKNDGFHR